MKTISDKYSITKFHDKIEKIEYNIFDNILLPFIERNQTGNKIYLYFIDCEYGDDILEIVIGSIGAEYDIDYEFIISNDISKCKIDYHTYDDDCNEIVYDITDEIYISTLQGLYKHGKFEYIDYYKQFLIIRGSRKPILFQSIYDNDKKRENTRLIKYAHNINITYYKISKYKNNQISILLGILPNDIVYNISQYI